LIEDSARERLGPFLLEQASTIKSPETYYRARIGYTEREVKAGLNTTKVKAPYLGSEISAPLPYKASAGRANRQGVSYLYLSSDEGTAIGEVRPHPGHYVSIAKFVLNSQISIVDLRFINLLKYYKNHETLEVFKLLRDLVEELSIPILPEEHEKYLVTQFICDVIRQLGYEGILFNSSVSTGQNLVAFNSKNFQYSNDSS
jgi:hypothetical protein